MNLKFGKGDLKSSLEEIESVFTKTFELDNTYTEGIITIVEFYGGLPDGNGGDKAKAENYAAMLEGTNLVAGAKAREILMPEDADYIEFWTNIADQVPTNADAHQALGRIYLFYDQIQQAEICYNDAMKIDPAKNTCMLDLGRYYLMMAMQNPAILDSVGPIIKGHFENYLNSSPEPCNPMKAWTYSKMAMIDNYSGNTQSAESNSSTAGQLDPFHSTAFGKPSALLFAAPSEKVHEQSYYFSPF
jgi:tetratricopeptide (TPR) repeat protein